MSINDFKKCLKIMKYNGDGATFPGFVICGILVQFVIMSISIDFSSVVYRMDIIFITFINIQMMYLGFSLWKTCRLTAGSAKNKDIFCRIIPFITGIYIVLSYLVLSLTAAIKSLTDGSDCYSDVFAQLVISAFAVLLYCIAEGFFGMKLIRAFFPWIIYVLLSTAYITRTEHAAVKAVSAFAGNIYLNVAVIVILAAFGPFIVSVLRKKLYTRYISSGLVHIKHLYFKKG